MFQWFLSISSPVCQTKFNNSHTIFLKQIDISFSCIYAVIDHESHYHISVKVAVDQQGDSQVDRQTTLKNMT